MIRNLILLTALWVVVAAAANVDQRPGRYTAAEDRDGAHHSSGGGASSYSAPAQQQPQHAPASSYSAPTNDQGNLYYYYYPVDEYGNTDVSSGFDVFATIILPLFILGGILLMLSSISFSTNGRSVGAEPGITDQLHKEVEKFFYIYLNALESESCIQRVVCQSGAYTKDYKNKEFYLSMVDPFIPETMKGNMDIFKMAAKDDFDNTKCKKYQCKSPKIFQ